jgi:hypothetical protein
MKKYDTLYKRRGYQGGCPELNFIEISFYFENVDLQASA